MMFKKIRWLVIASLVVLALVVGACGTPAPPPPPEETPAPEATTPPPEPTTPPPPPEEEIKLVFAGGAVGQELELTREKAERYMELYPNVTVEVLETPDYVQDRLGVYLQFFEAQSPDVDVMMIDVIWPGDLAQHLVDLYDYGAADVVDDYFPAIIENNTVDGRLVGIPWYVDAGMLYYRTDLLEKYDYSDPPSTWDELTEMAQTIQDGERAEGNADFWGYVWQGDSYEGLTCDALEWQYSNSDHNFISMDREVMVTDPDTIEAFEMATSWVGTISPPGVTGFGEETSREVWQAGNAAFMRNWPYAYSLGNADDSPIAGLFDVAALPAGGSGHGAATLGGWQIAVSKYSEHPEQAADLALFITGPEEQKRYALDGSFNPTIMDLYDDAEITDANPFMASLYDVFINAVARPSTATAPKYNETSVAYFTAVHSILTGESDATTAMQELEVDLEDIIATLD
jgi:trehalose/maltose transport system substrate-binding protein